MTIHEIESAIDIARDVVAMSTAQEQSASDTDHLLAWHYTTGEFAVRIAEAGVLLPTDAFIGPRERPVLWFSMEQDWEPTASKWCWQGSAVRKLDRWETCAAGRGLARFGIDPSKLIAWPALARVARIPPKTADGLVRAGLRQGAVPTRWRGSVDPIPLTECLAIEAWDFRGDALKDGSWSGGRRAI